MLKILFLIAFCSGVHLSVLTQDTLSVMYYNILNYPDESPERVGEIRQILGYAEPDVLVVNELLSEEGSNLILNEGLNVWGADNFEAAEYVDGPDTDNMLYYNSDLLGLAEQEQIPTGLRDISEYKLYYKSPGLGALSDTVFLYVYSLHLKAGTGFFNQRKDEVLVLKYRLNTLSNAENVLVGGDFNFYSGNESGCLAIRETGDVNLFDPIESIGDWNNNSEYANIHTQSTRTAPLSDGAGGGMDDRFDLIFVSEDVLNNANGVSFIDGSYEALGQDGNRFNQAINSPFNPTVPDSVASALYYMSDHLPVIMDLKLDYTAGINEHQKNNEVWYFDVTRRSLVFSETLKDALFTLYSYEGKLLIQFSVNNTNAIEIPTQFRGGLFLWTLTKQNYPTSGKLILN